MKRLPQTNSSISIIEKVSKSSLGLSYSLISAIKADFKSHPKSIFRDGPGTAPWEQPGNLETKVDMPF